jgi:hypothetical protein
MGQATNLLDEAARVWAKAQIVYESPSREGHPQARALAEEIAQLPECHEGLLAMLSSTNHLVVAYTLQTLEMMGSPALVDLPDELLDSKRNLTIQAGSFRNSMDLGGFARQIRKRAQEKARKRNS